ncbi:MULTISPECIES: hypothetical protein [unclassified Paraburkholderia]|uniref:hypothetical protein n=1 Tax=unclassified Paraburkholderia TaxID=2615204 RepID=UPI00161F666A|nr:MULTISPECIES: hypothetical protein [unclassified Paraburkholderia]MBB5443762.1 hypothetical protein [Paraburkholderia sp. WSM4177]MBB5485111.1 hypothetical protein [Paraburkholderia sp. WSM4180]
MNTDQKSLRWLIDKWLAPTPAMPVRLKRYGRANSSQRRCVRVESLRTTGSLAIFFFRHDDGSWRVFPPASRRPVMHAYQ